MQGATEPPTRVLVVDDDREIRELLAGYLAKQGIDVDTAADGAGMWRRIDAQSPAQLPDLIVLDLNLPGADGLALCRELRSRGHAMPVIMLTARADPIDRVVGLEIGADDYMGKPFEPRELVARIRTVLRRASGSPAGQTTAAPRIAGRIRFEGWTLDIAARALLSPQGTVVSLTSGEFRLLKVLAEHAGQVLSRDQILRHTQGRDATPFDRSIDLHVSRLRAKLRDDAREPRLLKTVRNEGYVLAAKAEPAR